MAIRSYGRPGATPAGSPEEKRERRFLARRSNGVLSAMQK